MGERGPVPKREGQRRRRNKPVEGAEVTRAAGAAEVEVRPAKASWHPAAKQWYESLAESGQSAFYEPSDWATAWVIAESMSRDLSPQVVGVNENTGEVVKASVPINGARLSAYLKAMGSLLTTEGERRRAHLELDRPTEPEGEPAGVSYIDHARRRRGGAG